MHSIKTFEDACLKLGIKPEDLELTLPKSLSHHGKAIIAHTKLIIIAEALNEGWKPDWSNSDERKYYPWFDMEPSASGRVSYGDYDHYWTNSFVGSRLCFKSRELAEYAGRQFIDLYSDYFII